MRKIRTSDLYDAADAAGTAVLMGLDPADPAALRLARVAQRRDSIDWIRRGTMRRTRDGSRVACATSIDAAGDAATPYADPRAADPATRAETMDTLARILRAAGWTENERRAILATARGADPRDVASDLGCSPATVYVHVSKARAKARAALGLD